ncbi:hypothetical protein ACFLXP_03550 [Chloroflexota bacterium]
MSGTFKSLATIMVWVLWVSSLVMGFGTLIVGIIAGDLFNPGGVTPMVYPALFATAGLYGILSVIIMVLRKKME